jgi:hypothetical protein
MAQAAQIVREKIPALDSAQGMQRTLLERKLDQAAARSGSLSRRVNLLGLIDPGQDAILGSWKVEIGQLVADNLELSSRLRIPYRPPAEYDFRIDFTWVKGNCILQILSHDHYKFRTDYSTFSLQQIRDVGEDGLGVGLVNANVIFHAIELTEIAGAGRQSPAMK